MSRRALAATTVLLAVYTSAARSEDTYLDPGDLDVGQVGRFDTRGGRLSFLSAADNPVGEGEVLVAPHGADGPGRPFLLRRVDVKRFPPGKPVQLDGTYRVAATRHFRGRFLYVLEPAK